MFTFTLVLVEIENQESIVLTSQSFAAVPNPKLVVGELLPITKNNTRSRKGKKQKTKNMVFPGQKKNKDSENDTSVKSFRLPKCLESFDSCVEDVDEMQGQAEGRELCKGYFIFIRNEYNCYRSNNT